MFVIATANDISQLPPELLRKGRTDEILFVDLPDNDERDAIWRIHIDRRGRDAAKLDVKAFVQLSEGFIGSEIQQAVTEALYDCFDQGKELDWTPSPSSAPSTAPCP